MSIEQLALRALKWAGLARLGAQAISWAVTLVVLRLLTPGDYGVMAIITVIMGILSNIAELGLGASVVQSKDLDQRAARSVAGAALTLNVAMGAVLALAAPGAAWLYEDPRLVPLIRVASLQFLCSAVMTVPQALAYREMDFRRLAAVEILQAVSAGLATLWVALSGGGVWALVIGTVTGAGVRTLSLTWMYPVRPAFVADGLRHHVRFGGTIAVSRLLWQVVYQSDALIGGLFLTKPSLGVYSISLHFATLPMQKIMSVINTVAFPAVARMQADPDRLRRRLLDASRLLAVVSVPLMWGLSSVGGELVPLLMGGNWQSAIVPFRVICLVVPLRMQNAIFNTAVMGIGRAGANLDNTLTSAIVLPVCFAVGARSGVDGLALSWAVAIPLVFLFNFPRMAAEVGVRSFDVLLATRVPLTAGALMYASVELMRLATQDCSPGIRLAALILTGATAYLATVWSMDRKLPGDLRTLMAAVRS